MPLVLVCHGEGHGSIRRPICSSLPSKPGTGSKQRRQIGYTRLLNIADEWQVYGRKISGVKNGGAELDNTTGTNGRAD
jgi:hypothetical protein